MHAVEANLHLALKSKKLLVLISPCGQPRGPSFVDSWLIVVYVIYIPYPSLMAVFGVYSRWFRLK